MTGILAAELALCVLDIRRARPASWERAALSAGEWPITLERLNMLECY